MMQHLRQDVQYLWNLLRMYHDFVSQNGSHVGPDKCVTSWSNFAAPIVIAKGTVSYCHIQVS